MLLALLVAVGPILLILIWKSWHEAQKDNSRPQDKPGSLRPIVRKPEATDWKVSLEESDRPPG